MQQGRPLSLSQIVIFAELAQALGGLFRSKVALGLGEEFVADHEFLNGRGTQEWRIKMRVQLPV